MKHYKFRFLFNGNDFDVSYSWVDGEFVIWDIDGEPPYHALEHLPDHVVKEFYKQAEEAAMDTEYLQWDMNRKKKELDNIMIL